MTHALHCDCPDLEATTCEELGDPTGYTTLNCGHLGRTNEGCGHPSHGITWAWLHDAVEDVAA